jgi:hypothetical protein
MNRLIKLTVVDGSPQQNTVSFEMISLINYIYLKISLLFYNGMTMMIGFAYKPASFHGDDQIKMPDRSRVFTNPKERRKSASLLDGI